MIYPRVHSSPLKLRLQPAATRFMFERLEARSIYNFMHQDGWYFGNVFLFCIEQINKLRADMT